MTEAQKTLVKDTVPTLKAHGVLLTTHFYNRMFTHNPELKHVFNMGNQQNNKQQTALAMAVLAYASHIDNPSVLMPVINSIGHKHTSLDIQPEQYEIVGNHLIASISEVLGNAATPALLEAWTVAYQQLAAIMSGHEQKVYEQQSLKNGGWTGWRSFILKQKIKESEEITSFYLYPEDGKAIADFQPGQYISLRLFLPKLNLWQPRQYSLSCAPNGTYYRISVKRESSNKLPDGMISNRLHQHFLIGDSIELSAPAGTFVLDHSSELAKVFISGGVGQTPLLSMLESLIQNDKAPKSPITWIHGCRNEKVHAFKDKIAEHIVKNKTINQHIFYEQSDSSDSFTYKGMVDLAFIKDSLINDQTEYYICGPAPFITKHYDFLVAQGIAKTSIYFEEFGPASLQLN